MATALHPTTSFCPPVCYVQIGIDFLEEEITKFEDLVQSVDVAAFNKV